jgi:hypothetical protein
VDSRVVCWVIVGRGVDEEEEGSVGGTLQLNFTHGNAASPESNRVILLHCLLAHSCEICNSRDGVG